MPTYQSPKELATDLYDEAVRPGDTGIDRLKLAVLSAAVAKREWGERSA